MDLPPILWEISVVRAGETEWGMRTPQLCERSTNLIKLSQRGQRGGKGVGKVAKVWHTHVSYTSPAIYWSIFSWKKELPFTQDLTGIHRRVPTRASVWLLQSGLNITVTLILKKPSQWTYLLKNLNQHSKRDTIRAVQNATFVYPLI